MGRGLATAAAAGGHKNDVVFEDCEDPINSTVSRKHARIVYEEETQSYVLYDERSARGTSLLRAGRSSKLADGSRGRRLADGDQILLGKAVVEFACPPS
jgi:pSer/pThr/pTyr-binding forkhead associated (FHA) protein